MRRPLVDINVLLDVLAQRDPFYEVASEIFTAAETGVIEGLVSADSFSTLYYLHSRITSVQKAKADLARVLNVFRVVDLSEQVLRQTLDSPVRDFEAAIQYHSALHGEADCIVTRDLRHFKNVTLPVYSPELFLDTQEV